MSKEIDEFVEGIGNESVRALVKLYMPAISRWVADAGWDAVRKWLYAYNGNDDDWYIAILKRMTVGEKRAEDKRRLAAVRAMGTDQYRRIEQERMFLRTLVDSLITNLVGKL